MQKNVFYEEGVSAGFPSPAEDYVEKRLDLHDLVVEHPAATFFVKVVGDSMIGAGIHTGDILVVDRSLSAKSGKVIVALFNGEFTVKRFIKKGEEVTLCPENAHYPPIPIKEGDDFQIWGVVTYVLHKLS